MSRYVDMTSFVSSTNSFKAQTFMPLIKWQTIDINDVSLPTGIYALEGNQDKAGLPARCDGQILINYRYQNMGYGMQILISAYQYATPNLAYRLLYNGSWTGWGSLK